VTSEADSAAQEGNAGFPTVPWNDPALEAEILGGLSETTKTAQEQPAEDEADEADETEAASEDEAGKEPPKEKQGKKKPLTELTDEELRNDERIRRLVQSEKDKELHRAKREAEQAAEAQEAARKLAESQAELEGLDDEELGVRAREALAAQKKQQELMQTVYQQAQTVIGQTFSAAQQQILESIPDAKVRATVQQRAEAGEFKSLPEFMAASVQAAAEVVAAKMVAKREKEMREANQNDRAAAEAEQASAPILGSGRPITDRDRWRKLSPDQQWAEGLAELGIGRK
jgi:hypothetical protein